MSANWQSARGIAIAVLIGLAAAAFPAGLRSQTLPSSSPLGPLPPGWTVSLTDVVAIFSGPTGEGSVTIVAPPVMTAEGYIKNAIIETAPSLIEDLFGEPRPGGDPTPLPASDYVAPGLLVPLTVELEDGSEARIEATGYPLRGGRLQLFLIAAPASMSSTNPELRTARTLVDQWRAAGVVVNENLTTDLAAPTEPAANEDGTAPAPAPPPVTPAADPDDMVENVIFFLRFTFDGTNPNAAGEPSAITAVLLKDGRVFESEARSPADFDPATRPPGSPGTGRWQRDGEAYALAFADGTQGTAVAGAAKTLPAPAAMAFAGRYVAIGGPASTRLTATIEFYPDGSILLKDENATLSGTYAITGRTIRLSVPGETDAAYIFGYRGDAAAPSLVIVGNRIYERADG
jgi:hypothetical protein